jgi:hypothetical protein
MENYESQDISKKTRLCITMNEHVIVHENMKLLCGESIGNMILRLAVHVRLYDRNVKSHRNVKPKVKIM